MEKNIGATSSNADGAQKAQAVPVSVRNFIERIHVLCGEEHKDWALTFDKAFANTLTSALRREKDGSTFLLTGDIPAMWLRDSTAQMRPYLPIAKDDPDLAELIGGLSRRQFFYITIDPYANAFNETPSGASWDKKDRTDRTSPWLWERKYEVDSLCYPVQLAWLLYRNTGYTKHFNADFVKGIQSVLDVFVTEQDHKRSPYFFIRDTTLPTDTLSNNGRGTPVAETGMTWSGFRPSDDTCTYHYLIPSNMFAYVILGYITRLFDGCDAKLPALLNNPDIVRRSATLRDGIGRGIREYGTTKNREGETVYAYEADGLGHASLMDDANIPNLLSAPYLGFCQADDPTYAATRRTLLSDENPYFYSGRYASGIGSSHTDADRVWPIALSIQGLTSESRAEKARLLDTLAATTAGTHLMHEGFDVNDPGKYTRPWFSWSNMMFCELTMDYFGIRVQM
ncbi:glycoside hydrolase family 125 protein [Bifidobacterium sp. ESL0745]|uniref:glycoside hydrolase family 125 protein n=1 Tax=Bifidobacterium sp. ESL0745 TaxID=2983226 RepID=UPI0023F7CE40|nr:glycoside hydrolase family 125 protein [Bifidobacterium sp. ESL0745]MDF7664702.1 glycoside hydrolase family 125 protein [Bifidobacterium sp. ESL0745]